ncbi:MAG: alkaline phosphatase family protein [Planctomycetota bacterium]
MSRRLWPILILLVLLGCEDELGDSEAPSTHPLIVFAIDGAEWSAVERLWQEGRLPHLKALAERGVRASVGSDYQSHSPVVWTTVATGVAPEDHGIVGFVVPTDQGDRPLSSELRRAPALWNMLSERQRKVAVLGWWATWPAEAVDGVVLTDRCLLGLEGDAHPAAFRDQVLRATDELGLDDSSVDRVARRDVLVGHFARELAGDDFDLILAYFKMVDRSSHTYWRYFDTESFAPLEEEQLAEHASEVPDAYAAVDAAIGRVLERAGEDVNIFVVSDHGFRPSLPPKFRIRLETEALLEKLGFLTREGSAVDLSQTRVYPWASASAQATKLLRFAAEGREEGGTVTADQREAIRAELEASAAKVTYESGAPVLQVRDANRNETSRGADFVMEVLFEEPSLTISIDGEPVEGIVTEIVPISGFHTQQDDGILIAAGPDFRSGTTAKGISIHGLAPTILYALGLPVADDFLRDPYLELFRDAFRRSHAVRRIPSYGNRESGEATATSADEAMVEELRQIGYVK